MNKFASGKTGLWYQRIKYKAFYIVWGFVVYCVFQESLYLFEGFQKSWNIPFLDITECFICLKSVCKQTVFLQFEVLIGYAIWISNNILVHHALNKYIWTREIEKFKTREICAILQKIIYARNLKRKFFFPRNKYSYLFLSWL